MDENREQVKSIFESSIGAVSKKIGCPLPQELAFTVEVPKNKEFGDYAVNIALIASAAVQKKPREVAEIFKQVIEKEKKTAFIERLEIAGPGFINVFLTKESRANILKVIQEQDRKFGFSNEGKGEKVLIEFVSANPTGPLTV
ncbi:MAG: arginine--tRNA ligase, partial [Candidatus Omnitrophica bacterium]|nr:arginine--tRNA ligase [Candidatus Omnitrophota bacterium]